MLGRLKFKHVVSLFNNRLKDKLFIYARKQRYVKSCNICIIIPGYMTLHAKKQRENEIISLQFIKLKLLVSYARLIISALLAICAKLTISAKLATSAPLAISALLAISAR